MREHDSEPFHLQPIDSELKAYVKEKKQLHEKIHNHWKLELKDHDLKTKKQSQNIINDDMFKEEQQWITIYDTASPEKKKRMDDAFSKLPPGQNDKGTSLIDMFTHLSGNSATKKVNDAVTTADATVTAAKNAYRVSSDVGTLIAQKLSKGEKIRVCKNGDPVKLELNENTFNFEELPKNSFANLFEDGRIYSKSNASILSWKDQIKVSDIKILEPKEAVPPKEKNPKPSRHLIVKKLNQEDEFKPRSNKFAAQSHEALKDLRATPGDKNSNSKRMNSREKLLAAVSTTVGISVRSNAIFPVHVVGVSSASSSALCESSIIDSIYKTSEALENNISNRNKSNGSSRSPELTLGKTLVPAKTKIGLLRDTGTENALSEKNYLQIIDNLTNRYVAKRLELQDRLLRSRHQQEHTAAASIWEELDDRSGGGGGVEASGLKGSSVRLPDRQQMKKLEKKYASLLLKQYDTSADGAAAPVLMASLAPLKRETLKSRSRSNTDKSGGDIYHAVDSLLLTHGRQQQQQQQQNRAGDTTVAQQQLMAMRKRSGTTLSSLGRYQTTESNRSDDNLTSFGTVAAALDLSHGRNRNDAAFQANHSQSSSLSRRARATNPRNGTSRSNNSNATNSNNIDHLLTTTTTYFQMVKSISPTLRQKQQQQQHDTFNGVQSALAENHPYASPESSVRSRAD